MYRKLVDAAKGKILITGGAGFIGSSIAKSDFIWGLGDKVVIIDNLLRTNSLRNLEDILDDSRYEIIKADLNEFNLEDLEDISFVFHLAATRLDRFTQLPQEGHNFNTNIGFKVANFCFQNKIPIFFASAGALYSRFKTAPYKEEDVYVSDILYGSSKKYIEDVLYNFWNMDNTFKYYIGRFFNVYGPGMDYGSRYAEVLIKWLDAAKNNKEITVYGDPATKTIDMIYIDDLVNAIEKIIGANNTQFIPNVYNISIGKGDTLKSLIEIIEYVTGIKLVVNQQKLKISTNVMKVPKKLYGDSERLKSIGWSQVISLEKGIERVWKWYKNLK